MLRKYKLAKNVATGNIHYERFAVVHLAEDLATSFTHPLKHLKLTKDFFADAVKAWTAVCLLTPPRSIHLRALNSGLFHRSPPDEKTRAYLS